MTLQPGAYVMLGLCGLYVLGVLVILLWVRRRMVESPAPGPPAPSSAPAAPVIIVQGGVQGGPAPIPSWAGMAGPRQWYEVVVEEEGVEGAEGVEGREGKEVAPTPVAPAPVAAVEESPFLSKDWQPLVPVSSEAEDDGRYEDTPEMIEAARSGVGAIRRLRAMGVGYKRAARLVRTYGPHRKES